MDLNEFTAEEIEAIKQVTQAAGQPVIDLTKLPAFSLEQKDAIIKFYSELSVIPSIMSEGTFTEDDMPAATLSVTNAAITPLIKPLGQPISPITFSVLIALTAYTWGIHDAATGTISEESLAQVAARVGAGLRKSDELRSFHEWLKDL